MLGISRDSARKHRNFKAKYDLPFTLLVDTDAEIAKADEVVVPVQVNGKVRSRLTVSAEASEAELERLALADPAVQAYTSGKRVVKVVVARGRLVNIVVQ